MNQNPSHISERDRLDADSPLPRLLEGVVTLRKISAGAYGTVFLGRDAARRELAVKALHPQVPQEGQERERQGLTTFLEEFQNGDDHLLTVHQISPPGQLLRYSMELADNLNDPHSSDDYAAATLGAWMERHGAATVEQVVDWMHQLLDGVGALHAHGLIHRDLKPGNLYFVRGRLKIGDYGLVTRWNPESTLIGTEAYIPGGLKAAAPEMDLYALGKILYTLVTGLPVREYPRIPREKTEDRALGALNRFVLERACSDDPARRFRTVQTFREAFDRICNPAERLQRRRLLKRRLQATAFLAVVILAAALGGVWLRDHLTQGGADYLPEPMGWFEQISPSLGEMRLAFHEERTAEKEQPPGREVSLLLEEFPLEKEEFELYFEATSDLRLAELRVEFLDSAGAVAKELHSLLTPRGVYSETTLIPGEPRGALTWGIRILARKKQEWLLLANGRPVLDTAPPGDSPPWRLRLTLSSREEGRLALKRLCVFTP
ncbi:MAG: serine/threonine protein kinase [Oligosphaeraceae bacterium]